MTLFVYSCFALPMLAAMFAVYFILRKARLSKESLIAKCAGSFLSVGSAGFALYIGGVNPFAEEVFWFFVLCALADALLELQFVAGVVAFGAAHACLMVWLWGETSPGWAALIVWAAAYAVGALLFCRDIPKLGKMTVPCFTYLAVLGGALALAAPLPFKLGADYWCVAIGALCFFVSDMMVAKMELVGCSKQLEKPIMVLYWAALYLIAAGLW